MAKAKNKNAKWIIPAFFVISFVLVIVNQRQSPGLTRVVVTNNRGVPMLASTGNQLVASESGGGFYLFDWSNPKAGHQQFPAASKKSVLMDRSPLVSVSYTASDNSIVLLNERGENVLRIKNYEPAEQAYLLADSKQQRAFLISRFKRDSKVHYIFNVVDIEKSQIQYVGQLAVASDFQLRAFAASESGHIAVAGRKSGQAYAALINTEKRKVAWEEMYSDFSDFSGVAFSTNGQKLFVGSEEGTISVLETQTGHLTQSVELVAKPRKNTNSRTIQTVISSPGGKWIACACDPEVFILEQSSCKLYKTLGSSHKIVTGLVFSPDDVFLATSDLRASGTIDIFEVELIKGN